MNILILVESLELNKTSSGIGRAKLINILNKKNSISVIYPKEFAPGSTNLDPDWIENVKLKKFQPNEADTFEKLLNKVPKVRALPSYLTGMSLSFSRIINAWEMAIEEALNQDEYDFIFVLGTGMSFAPHFAMANIDPGIPWIANIHDPFPAHYYPEPYRKKSNIIYKRLASHFDKVIRRATKISFPSLRLKEWMQKFYPEIEKKSFILPHPMIDESMISKLPCLETDSIVSLKDNSFNLTHAGSLLGPRNPHHLIMAFRRFVQADPEIKKYAKLNIVGKVAREHSDILKKYNQFSENINIVTERVSYRHSLSILKQSDVLILLEAAAKESPFMPGKLADYFWADKPILALTPPKSETSRLLGKEYPYITEADNEEAIYHILIELWDRWKSEKMMVLNRQDLRDYISGENIRQIITDAMQ